MIKRPMYLGHVNIYVRNTEKSKAWYENLLGIYLRDPDGNGVEIYYELPRAEWPVDYHVFSRDKVGSGRFPGPWDAERVDQLSAPQPAVAA